MPQNVQLSDEANAVLDEFIVESDKKKEKGKTASEAVVESLLPELSPTRQQLILGKYPGLARFKKKKK